MSRQAMPSPLLLAAVALLLVSCQVPAEALKCYVGKVGGLLINDSSVPLLLPGDVRDRPFVVCTTTVMPCLYGNKECTKAQRQNDEFYTIYSGSIDAKNCDDYLKAMTFTDIPSTLPPEKQPKISCCATEGCNKPSGAPPATKSTGSTPATNSSGSSTPPAAGTSGSTLTSSPPAATGTSGSTLTSSSPSGSNAATTTSTGSSSKNAAAPMRGALALLLAAVPLVAAILV